MNFKVILITTLVISQSIALTYATDDESSTAIATDTQTNEVTNSTAANLPKLNIHWDCGTCTINEKIIPLLESNYLAAATKNNTTISETDTADVFITKFRQRKPAMRILFGVMAGTDQLELKISYKGKELIATDYSANIAQGMNALCESVADSAYKQLAVATKK